MFDWYKVKQLPRVECRHVTMGFGILYVTMSGTSGRPEWFVDNWDMVDVSFINCLHFYVWDFVFFHTVSFPKEYEDSFYVWSSDKVECKGNESKLSHCEHGDVGVHRCVLGKSGVICHCKCSISTPDL